MLKIIILAHLVSYSITFEVTVEQGKLRGTSYTSRNGTEYYGFLGIPYARPPTGELRFQPPQAPESWNGTRDATLTAPKCAQKGILSRFAQQTRVEGQEDCLYLNVYTPTKKSSPLPVIVSIHGGGLGVGDASSTMPEYFMDHAVVFVTIQFRLHVLGFLSTGDLALPGNNGIKDQVAALKWIQKNIAAFSGDPANVTLIGDSSGAACVHYHMHSPLSTGLFHRAISQSGTALAVWAHTSRSLARRRAYALGTQTRCPISSSEALVDCLKKIPTEELVIASHKFFIWNYHPITSFSVTPEPQHDGAFITQNPWYHEVVNNVPWICGINSAEGAVIAASLVDNNGARAKEFDKHYKWLLPIALFYGFWYDDQTKIDQISESLRKNYFGDKNIGIETTNKIVQLFTDASFMHTTREAVRRYKGPVYFYYFDHRNNRSFSEIFGEYEGDLGVSHMDALISLHPIKGLFPDITEGDDYRVSDRMVKYWVNFARNGNPNNVANTWTPVQSDDLQYLHITTNRDQMKTGLLPERYEFWKNFQLKPPIEEVSSTQRYEL